MNLRWITPWAKSRRSGVGEPDSPITERCLSLLAEGAAENMPEFDHRAHKLLRAKVASLLPQLPLQLDDQNRILLTQDIVHEFESCRIATENLIRERTSGWRSLVALLFREVLESLGSESTSPTAKSLEQAIARLSTAKEIQAWRGQLADFLHPPDTEGIALGLASVKVADRSTANDNAAGLRGGGSAVDYLKSILERGGTGFIALFRLSCLDVIKQRFGVEAVEDCLMAVSAFLTASLHNDDQIFHWSDSSLLAILQGRPSAQILTAELQRIASQNPESSIHVAGRTIMLRIPLAFDLTPIHRLRTPEDLFRLSPKRATQW